MTYFTKSALIATGGILALTAFTSAIALEEQQDVEVFECINNIEAETSNSPTLLCTKVSNKTDIKTSKQINELIETNGAGSSEIITLTSLKSIDRYLTIKVESDSKKSIENSETLSSNRYKMATYRNHR